MVPGWRVPSDQALTTVLTTVILKESLAQKVQKQTASFLAADDR